MNEDKGIMVSVRLPDRVLRPLRLTVGRRKAEQIRPNTQTEIIIEALQEWLNRETDLTAK